MTLAKTIEALQKRPLTSEELANITEFQKTFSIDDSDPLIVVLAMMARSQLIVEALPGLLQQKSEQTIELHRNTLREQSVLISKELVGVIAQQIGAVNLSWKTLWIRYVAFFGGGMFTAIILRLVFAH